MSVCDGFSLITYKKREKNHNTAEGFKVGLFFMSMQHGPYLLVHGELHKTKFIQPKNYLLSIFVLRFLFFWKEH